MDVHELIPSAVSVIIPTIGRPDSLRRLLESLCRQTALPQEIVVADSSATTETEVLLQDPRWPESGLKLRRVVIEQPNAVRQREAAILASTGSYLLLLDDDVVVEPTCIQELLAAIRSGPDVVAVVADFNNQVWPMPTRLWRLYLKHVLAMPEGSWQGCVVGPLLRFGYQPRPQMPKPMQWLPSSNTLVRRAAYEQVGGFSKFFLHRCTMNEDVDLGLKLSRIGRILLCPAARAAHFHAPGGRLASSAIAEDDLYNRFFILYQTLGKSVFEASAQTLCFFTMETLSNAYWSIRRYDPRLLVLPLCGRAGAMVRIAFSLCRTTSKSASTL